MRRELCGLFLHRTSSDQTAALPIAETLRRGLDESSRLCRFGNLTWSNSPRLASTRSQQPDTPAISQWTEGVNETIHEIAVIFAPPHHNHVAEFIGLLFHEVVSQDSFNGCRNCWVPISVAADLKGNHALSNAEHGCIVVGYASSVSHRGVPPLILKTKYEVIRNCIAPYL